MVERKLPNERELHVLRRLNEFYISASLGDYFRGRVHGWLSLHAGHPVELPAELLERLGSGDRRARIVVSTSTPEQLALDAAALAYHASETYCRQVLAVLTAARQQSSPALALKFTPTGRTFSESLAALTEDDATLDAAVDLVFLPLEVRRKMAEQEVDAYRNFLRQWTRHHVRRIETWKNPNNSFKHGLAATAPVTQLAFVADPPNEAATAHPIMDGHVVHTLEHEVQRGTGGSKFNRLSWWHRAVDPIELIADVLTTADTLDWLKAVARGRLLGEPVMVPLQTKPLPGDLHKPGAPGVSFRLDIGAVPLLLDTEGVEKMNALLDQRGGAGTGES